MYATVSIQERRGQVMARSKDYWIYQEKREQLPWVIHIVAVKEGRIITADVDFFAEWLCNGSKRLTIENVPLYRTGKRAGELVAQIEKICRIHGIDFTERDERLIQDDIETMLSDF